MKPTKLPSVTEIFALIDEGVAELPSVRMPLGEAVGCVLAEAVQADADQPSVDRSAIDGFAVIEGSPAGDFVLKGEVLPGEAMPIAPREGEALRVYTGSAVPAGCALVMVEEAEVRGEMVRLRLAADESLVRRRGSSIRAGAPLLPPGTLLGSGEVALLASVGAVQPLVVPHPRVLHITTGREIVPPSAVPVGGQIRDTNGPMLQALILQYGAEALPRRHVDEAIHSLMDALGSSASDLVLVSGGSSVGAHDNTAAAFESAGFTLLSRQVNARPGKPLLVARRGRQWAFGLPGNPVSHFAAFHVFVARALRRMQGLSEPAPWLMEVAPTATIESGPRETFWPARLERQLGAWRVYPLPWLDSGDLKALIGVDALIRIPARGVTRPDGMVEIIPCVTGPWSRLLSP